MDTTTQTTTTEFRLPPWGKLDEGLIEPGSENKSPAHWQDLMDYTTWRAGVIDVIDRLLWPQFDRRATWESPEVRRLNDVDFVLLHLLHANFRAEISVAHETTVRHAEFFKEEDRDGVAFGAGYERYDPKVPYEARDGIRDVVLEALRDKAGGVSGQLKSVFQRPRAYQLALLQNRKFGHLSAHTANTPALISGHCFQGAITGCNLYLHVRKYHASPLQLEVLKQFTVDIGDRRVFAGVHYPSDNLSSWFTALALVPHVFPSDVVSDVRRFLWSAISNKSVVYKAMRDWKCKDAGSPYAAMLDKICEVGTAE